jgi:hypothetical protein
MTKAIFRNATPAFLTDFGAAWEGDSIVASKPPSAGTTSFAWRFAAEFAAPPAEVHSAVSGTNMTNMESRLTAFKASISALLPSVDLLLVYAQMGNGLLEQQADELAQSMLDYFDEIKALDPAKVRIIASYILHRDNDDLAPGDWESEVNEHNGYMAALYYRFDGLMRWQELSGTFSYANAKPMSFASPVYPDGDGIHPNDTTNEEMTDLLVIEAQNQLSLNRPSNSVVPAVTGTTTQGSTLTSTAGTWSNSGTITYQWHRSGSPFPVAISAATNSTYVLAAADVGTTIFCVTTNTRSGIAVHAKSNTTATITAPAGSFGDLVHEDYTTWDDIAEPSTSIVSGPGTGPLGGFAEYTVDIDSGEYTYRQAFVSEGIPQNPAVGETLHIKMAVKGTVGETVAVVATDVNGGTDHDVITFDGNWQEVNIALTIVSLANGYILMGLDKRGGIYAGSGVGNSTFLVWGVKFTKT